MNGNPHYARVEDSADEMQTEAILALAWEQRTANLIAKLALNAQVLSLGTGFTLTKEADVTDNEILARLGLDQR